MRVAKGRIQEPHLVPSLAPSRGSSLLTPWGSPPVRFLFCFCFCFGHAAQLVESQSYITQLLTGSNRYFGDTPSFVLMHHPPKTQPIKVWADACKTHSLDKQIAVHPQNGTPLGNNERINKSPIHSTTQMYRKALCRVEEARYTSLHAVTAPCI